MFLKRCCFCCDLRSGAVFIGITQILIGLAALILSFLSFGYRQQISHELRLSGANQSIPLVTLVMIFCSFLKLCSCILLISGASRRSHLELMPWLVIESIGMFASYVMFMVLSVFVLHVCTPWGLGMFLIGNSFIGISVYWWFCVYSLYCQFQKKELNRHNDVEQLIHNNNI